MYCVDRDVLLLDRPGSEGAVSDFHPALRPVKPGTRGVESSSAL